MWSPSVRQKGLKGPEVSKVSGTLMCNLPRERQVLLTRTQEGEGTARDAWHGPQPTLLNVHTADLQGAEGRVLDICHYREPV